MIYYFNGYWRLVIGICVALLLFGGFANAQGVDTLGLSVSPQLFEIDVFPGQTLSEKIALKNLSEVPMPILIKTTDFFAQDYSGEMEFEESLQDPMIASRKWFEFEKPNFIMEAGDKEIINFKISVPQDAEPGGHYSVVIFEPQLPDFYFKAGLPKTIPVIGVLFMISVRSLNLEPGVIDDSVEIVEFKIPNEEKNQNFNKVLASVFDIMSSAEAEGVNIVENPPDEFILKIKNNDIFHHKLNGTVSVYNSFGNKVAESEIKKTTILPGRIREFPISITKENPDMLNFLPANIADFIAQNTSLGKYKVVLDLSGERDDLELSQTMTFWAFPWKSVLLLCFFLFIIISIRKRLIFAARILVKR